MNATSQPSAQPSAIAQAVEAGESLLDADVRQAIRDNPRQYAIDNGIIAANSDIEVKLVTNDRHTMHIPLTQEESFNNLSDDQLQSMQAAGISTAGSLGSASTLLTAGSCASTLGSIGTAGSGGSVKTGDSG